MRKVSIIIPFYNTPSIPLRECIESIQNQSYKNLEILLVNDGSIDDCTKICIEYCDDKRVKLISKENGGVSSARNIGLQEATGDYIMFVDADDMLCIDAVEIMVNSIEQTHADIIICNYKRFYKNIPKLKNTDISEAVSVYENSKDLVKIRKKCLHEDDSLGIKFNGAPWGKLYSVNIIRKNNLKFNQLLIRSQDNYFNFQVFGKAKRIGYINAQLYLYRYLPTSSVNRFRENLFEISQRYLDCIEKQIILENNIPDYNDTITQIKLEKFSEYVYSYISHPKNFDRLNIKISNIKKAEEHWLGNIGTDTILKQVSSKREKILYKLITAKKYTFAYAYTKLLNKLKYYIIKLYYNHG